MRLEHTPVPFPAPVVNNAVRRAHHPHDDPGHHAYLHRPVTILERVGDTPLLKVQNLTAAWGIAPDVAVYAKAEWFNPGGSVKDRAALHIMRVAVETGQLTPDKILIDSTSGNTGIAYAWIGASQGYRVTLVMPENVSAERKKILYSYGAELIFTDPLEGSDGAIEKVRALVTAHPERYFYANQYDNPANWQAHYLTTGPEIWAQTQGGVTHFVASVGTSGTLMGAGRFLREMNNEIQIFGVQPADELSVIEGLKHIPTAIRPAIYDERIVDNTLWVESGTAYDMARTCALREGWFVGFSAGAALHAALTVAKGLEEGVVITVLPDGGAKYLSLL